jgi:NAD(P)-dependent dehydrogenase (short-subunit alcohol dehydrogenase family)
VTTPGPAARSRARQAGERARVADAAELAAFAAFLLSDESAFITGAALAMDGGSTASA